MRRAFDRPFHAAILANSVAVILFFFFAGGCGSSSQKPGNDAGSEIDTGLDPDAGMPDTGGDAVVIALSETAYTFATPDLHHGLTATVTGTPTTTVTCPT